MQRINKKNKGIAVVTTLAILLGVKIVTLIAAGSALGIYSGYQATKTVEG